MPKHIIEFNLPEETEELKNAMQGTNALIALEDMWEHLFRPFYKHGYKNEELNKLAQTKSGSRTIELLADLYREVLKANNIE
jgi:hypothetical protein